jgi:hypothetical protein
MLTENSSHVSDDHGSIVEDWSDDWLDHVSSKWCTVLVKGNFGKSPFPETETENSGDTDEKREKDSPRIPSEHYTT